MKLKSHVGWSVVWSIVFAPLFGVVFDMPWTIVIASTFDPLFPEARGLALDPDSNLMNDIAFLLFVVGIGIVIAIMIRIAWQCLFSAR